MKQLQGHRCESIHVPTKCPSRAKMDLHHVSQLARASQSGQDLAPIQIPVTPDDSD